MRILAIRGRNLASLAGDFEVDLGAEPLASAGVFAISGPTGAGKSTLLDALCLALYHQTPRLRAAGELQVAIPDVKDQTLSPQDPRNLLRRGSAEGFAEVDFEDQDAVVWRARWSVARAHGKVGRKLQAPSVRLARRDSGTPIAGTTQEIRDTLRKLTGLSFEQFCRSVLLAQNDFAALLKARQEERAGLLEALTGSEIFSRISQLAHERNAVEHQQLKELQQAMHLQAPLGDHERDALEQRLIAARTHCTDTQAHWQALLVERAWHVRLAELGAQRTRAAAEATRLQQMLSDGASEAEQVRRWSAAEPLRPLHQLHQQTLGTIASEQAQLPALGLAVATAMAQSTAAAIAENAAAALLADALAADSAAQPTLAAARSADQKLAVTQAALHQALREVDREELQQRTLALRSADQERELRALSARMSAWETWQQAHPHLDGAATRWQALGMRLDAAVRDRQRCAALRSRHAAAAQQLAAQADRLADADAAHQCNLSEAERAAQALVQAEAAWQQQDAGAVAAQRVDCERRERAAEHLGGMLEAFARAQAQQADTYARHAELQQQIAQQRPAVDAAATVLETAYGRDHDARVAWQHACLLADAHTQQLRETLVAGEPCPVCGALTHPAAAERSHDLSAVLDGLRQRADAARQHCAEAIAAHEQARTVLAATTGELERASAALAHTTEAVNTAGDAVRVAAHSLLPEAHTVDAVRAALPEFLALLAAQSGALVQAQLAIDAALAALESARRRQRAAQAQEALTRSALAAIHAELAPRRDALATLEGELRALTDAVDAAMTQLRDWPALGALPDDRLLSARDDWRVGDGIRNDADAARLAATAASATLSSLQEQTAAAAQAVSSAQTQVTGARQQVEAARAERLRVLAHADVEAYAAQMQQRVSTARNHLEAERERRQSAERLAQQAVAAQERAQQQLLAAQARGAQLATQLQAELAVRASALLLPGADLEALAHLIDSLPDDLEQRRQHWQQQTQNWREREAQVATLDGELNDWQQHGASARERASVEQALEAAAVERDLALQQFGAFDSAWTQDQARRAAAAEQLAEFTTRRAQAQRWATLDALIGSADGSRFKRYAQQFTLEVLLSYANEHLRRLAPRYRLRRGLEALSLLIVDSDLGDEVRSVHSLSGGETFLVALALALGLASLASERVRVESLFIDEGFGSLDADALNTAMDALDRLQSEGRRVGVISHFHDLAERIGAQVRVEPIAPGTSRVRVLGA